MNESKCDRLLLNNFQFDGKVRKYLYELPFEEARVIFMLRVRMFPTKGNFKGRWGSDECEYCGCLETDIHLFTCPGYSDLLDGVDFEMFLTLNASNEKLSFGARKMLKVLQRLKTFNASKD